MSEVKAHVHESRNYTGYVCAGTLLDGTPVSEPIRKRCTATSEVGDRLAMIIDPAGQATPTEERVPPALDTVSRTTFHALLFAAAYCFAAVRSPRGRNTGHGRAS